MKLKFRFTIMDIGGDLTAVPVDIREYPEVIRLNGFAADVMEILADDVTEIGIVERLCAKQGIDRTSATDKLRSLLEKLRKEGLLSE